MRGSDELNKFVLARFFSFTFECFWFVNYCDREKDYEGSK